MENKEIEKNVKLFIKFLNNPFLSSPNVILGIVNNKIAILITLANLLYIFLLLSFKSFLDGGTYLILRLLLSLDFLLFRLCLLELQLNFYRMGLKNL